MKPLTDYRLQEKSAFVYVSPLAATAAALDHPHNTPLAGEINTLVLAYLNQWGFLLSAYSRLYNIQSRLSKANDKIDPAKAEQNPAGLWPFTEYDHVTVHLAADIRDYVYILVISMNSILDFYIGLVDAVRKKEAPTGRNMIGLNQFRNNVIGDNPNSPFNFLTKTATPLPDRVAEIRNRIVHRGYSIRTNHSFTKETDLPIRLFLGNDYTDETYNFSVGRLFDDFYTTIRHLEQKAADILPTVQPDLLLSPKLSVSYHLDGDATLIEFKEIDDPDVSS